MSTNVMNFMVPAGLFSGTEPFWYDNQKWLIHKGECKLFVEFPLSVRNMVIDKFLQDKDSRVRLHKMGIRTFSEGFERWYKCIVGGLDSIPDISEKGIYTPDAYTNTCNDLRCPDRGSFCSRQTGLKNYEISTIKVLAEGKTLEEAADILCISHSGMKSRLEQLKYKLKATNMASLVATCSAIGII